MTKVVEVMEEDGTGGEISGNIIPTKKSGLAVAKFLFRGDI